MDWLWFPMQQQLKYKEKFQNSTHPSPSHITWATSGAPESPPHHLLLITLYICDVEAPALHTSSATTGIQHQTRREARNPKTSFKTDIVAYIQTLIGVTDRRVALDRGGGYTYSFNSAEC